MSVYWIEDAEEQVEPHISLRRAAIACLLSLLVGAAVVGVIGWWPR